APYRRVHLHGPELGARHPGDRDGRVALVRQREIGDDGVLAGQGGEDAQVVGGEAVRRIPAATGEQECKQCPGHRAGSRHRAATSRGTSCTKESRRCGALNSALSSALSSMNSTTAE